jgi:hypothetical protein
MKLKFEKTKIEHNLWDQWTSGPYKITSFQSHEFYPYFHNVSINPRVNSTLIQAKEACDKHALTTIIPRRD